MLIKRQTNNDLDILSIQKYDAGVGSGYTRHTADTSFKSVGIVSILDGCIVECTYSVQP